MLLYDKKTAFGRQKGDFSYFKLDRGIVHASWQDRLPKYQGRRT